MSHIDIKFDFRSDTPEGKDADTYSSTLRSYHQILWSKCLPNGKKFDLDLNTPHLLHHNSTLGEFFLSSDAIGHTYKNAKRMSHIIEKIPSQEIEEFYSLTLTIGAFIIFPSKTIDKKMTINAARGTNQKIRDRYDLTLECIRCFYLGENNPLADTLKRYSSFLNLFSDFKGYVDFFLLQDLVDEDYSGIRFWHPFVSFDNQPLPENTEEYYAYKESVMNFINLRSKRILDYSNSFNLSGN